MTAIERDAARYRWLRNNSLAYPYRLAVPAVFRCDNDLKIYGQPLDGPDLDRQIDAAMKEEPMDSASNEHQQPNDRS